MKVLIWFVISFFITPFVCSGQDELPRLNAVSIVSDENHLTVFFNNEDMEKTLKGWINKWSKWKEQDKQFANRFKPKPLIGGERLLRPTPPLWLASFCNNILFIEETLLLKGCQFFFEWGVPVGVEQIKNEIRTKTESLEIETKTSWMNLLHFDFGYTTPSMGTRSYGLVGLHTSLPEIGRVQISIPPGIMVVSIPTTNGWVISPATTWGVGVRILNFNFPRTTKSIKLHINFLKIWMFGSNTGSSKLGIKNSMDVVGFSITK